MSKFDENIFGRIALFNDYMSKDQLDESRDWIRSTLGVEIYTLALTEDEAAKHLIHYLERGGRPVSRKLRQAAESVPAPVDEPPNQLYSL